MSEGRDYWSISDARIEEDDDPRIVVSDDGVLLGTRSAAQFRPSSNEGQGSPVLRTADGLWHRGGSNLPEGALVLPGGLPGRYATRELPPAAVFTGRGPVVRTLSPALLERLDRGPESRVSAAAQRLGAAARSAGLEPDDRTGRRERTLPGSAPMLDLVSDADLGPFGPVTVLSVRRTSEFGRTSSIGSSVVAASGGSTTAGTDGAVVLLRPGAVNGLRQVGGPRSVPPTSDGAHGPTRPSGCSQRTCWSPATGTWPAARCSPDVARSPSTVPSAWSGRPGRGGRAPARGTTPTS